MRLLKFLAVVGLLTVQRSGHLHAVADRTGNHWTVRPRRPDHVQVITRLAAPPASTLRISGLQDVISRREPLPKGLKKILPRIATCQLVSQLIIFEAAENPSEFEFQPPCMRVNRCSGCCGNCFLSCQIKRAVFRELQVIVQHTRQLGERGTLTKVIVEEHEACACACTIKAEQQCSSKADFNENLCRCICRDTREENKCAEKSQRKIWNRDTCTCDCKRIDECSEGLEFDYLDCVCKLKNRNKGSHE